MAPAELRFNATAVRAFVVFSRIAAAVVAALALLTLGVWASGAQRPAVLVAPGIGPHVGFAFASLLAASALLLARRARAASIVLSLLVVAFALAELLHHLAGVGAGPWSALDRRIPALHLHARGPLPHAAALILVLLGAGGAAVAARCTLWLREALLLGVIGLAVAATAGYGLVLAGGEAEFLGALPLLSALAALLLALAWMASVPTTGLTRITVADSTGGAFARRLILPSLLLPLVMTFAVNAARSLWGMPEGMALALAAAATGGTVAALILRVAFLLDRDERTRRMAADLRRDADTDALTGLANRRRLDAALTEALAGRRGAGPALLLLDLDHFKAYNDAFGHQAGDEALRHVGHLLRASVRGGDLAARYGGEEFALLLADAGPEGPAAMGERVLAAFRDHAWPHRPVTTSIGTARAAPGDDPAALLHRADRALYAAKQSGRDRQVLAPEAVAPRGN